MLLVLILLYSFRFLVISSFLILGSIWCPGMGDSTQNEQEWFFLDRLPTGSGKIMSVALTGGDGWIGTRPEGPPTSLLLYRIENGILRPVRDFPVTARRADVLDISPSGSPWVCTFNPESGRAADARLNYYDDSGWTSIPVDVEIWPTDLDMVSDSEGWISGHFGELAHYLDGKWFAGNPGLDR